MRGGGASVVDPFLTLTPNYDVGDGSRAHYNTIGAQVALIDPRPVPGERSEAIIIRGQSTASNWGGGTSYVALSSRSHMGNPFNGAVYPARDPMFFCDGVLGTPISALGDQRIALGLVERVLVINTAWGTSSSLQQADTSGQLWKSYLVAVNFLLAHGWKQSQIKEMFIHGEKDAESAIANPSLWAANYVTNINTIAANKATLGLTFPMWISRCTFPYGSWVTSDPNSALWTPGAAATAIRGAQLSVVNGTTIRQGFDTDTIRGSSGRGVGAHWATQAERILVAAGHAAAIA